MKRILLSTLSLLLALNALPCAAGEKTVKLGELVVLTAKDIPYEYASWSWGPGDPNFRQRENIETGEGELQLVFYKPGEVNVTVNDVRELQVIRHEWTIKILPDLAEGFQTPQMRAEIVAQLQFDLLVYRMNLEAERNRAASSFTTLEGIFRNVGALYGQCSNFFADCAGNAARDAARRVQYWNLHRQFNEENGKYLPSFPREWTLQQRYDFLWDRQDK